MLNFPYKIIDLSHTLEEGMPCWDLSCGFQTHCLLDYVDCEPSAEFKVMSFTAHAGIGTHIDAPSHCFPKGKSIHELSVSELVFPCFVIDISHKSHERYSLSADDIAEFEKIFGPITAKSAVLINTNWARYWDTPSKYHNQHIFPSISKEAARALLDRGVSAIGIDTLSPDRPCDGFHTHQLVLGAGKIIIENVANLHTLPATGAILMVFPLKIKKGTESPVRLVALCP